MFVSLTKAKEGNWRDDSKYSSQRIEKSRRGCTNFPPSAQMKSKQEKFIYDSRKSLISFRVSFNFPHKELCRWKFSTWRHFDFQKDYPSCQSINWVWGLWVIAKTSNSLHSIFAYHKKLRSLTEIFLLVWKMIISLLSSFWDTFSYFCAL